MGNHIYTIGREFGSGGYEVGRMLAERLGIKLYDKELLAQAAKSSGFCKEIFENHDEKPTSSFLYSLVIMKWIMRKLVNKKLFQVYMIIQIHKKVKIQKVFLY